MKLLSYVAGPYADARGHFGVLLNIQRATMVAMKLRQQGYAVFCPHCNTAHQDGLVAEEQFLEECFCFLENCAVCFIVPNMPGYAPVEESKGTMREIQFCHARAIPVVSVSFSNGVIILPDEWRYGDEKNRFYDRLSYEHVDGGVPESAGEICADAGQ